MKTTTSLGSRSVRETHPAQASSPVTGAKGFSLEDKMKAKTWTPPAGWFKAAHDARDTEAMYQLLVADNARREARGLPTFEPSYQLAATIVKGGAA